MDINFTREPNRVYALDASRKLIAEITFPETSPGRVDINHTFVDPSLRGQGVADGLVRAAADVIRTNGLKAAVSCSYAVRWFENHPEHGNLLV